MKKVSFKFSDFNSLRLFSKKTTAINVSIKPTKNIISGLFDPAEVEMALKEFNATPITDNLYEHNHI